MDSNDLNARVKTLAHEGGFDLAGIASISSLPRAELLSEWIHRGWHADMSWLPRRLAERRDPVQVLPGCRSVIMVGVNYWNGTAAPPADNGRLHVARYAWGRDYHRVVGRMLRRFGVQMREIFPEERFWWEVDTGPLQERAWACQAGLGWIGCNGLLIHQPQGDESGGSWFLLGAILTTLEIAADVLGVGRCGQCRRCIEACPTGAIGNDGLVDSRRCIAWATIEQRGQLDLDTQGWAFGCDICQEVCPWNRLAQPGRNVELTARPEWTSIHPVELLEMTEDSFRRVFAGSSVMRAGLERLRAICGRAKDGSDLSGAG
jgi:epoxyqueuosine reductase